MKKYQIGDICFSYVSPEYTLKENLRMERFAIDVNSNEQNSDEIVYEIHLTDLSPFYEGKIIKKNGLYEIHEISGEIALIYHWNTYRYAFCFWLKDVENRNRIPCYINQEMKDFPHLDMLKIFSSAGMHSKLLQNNAIVFHAAYIEWKRKAILFAGPSGTGKTTQADLWVEHMKAEIINGDRALLRKKEGQWMAYGYPLAGSSDDCINRTLPIGAIILLEQSKENEICSMGAGEKYRAILTGSELHAWNETEIKKVSTLTEEIIMEVPIIKLKCMPDMEAVFLLKRSLEELE